MPNWCTNEIAVRTEDEFKQLVDAFVNDEGEVDFGKIFPMPDCLNDTEAGFRTNALLAIGFGLPTQPVVLQKQEPLVYNYLSESLKIQKELADNDISLDDYLKRHDLDPQKCENAANALKETGFASWYDWRQIKWGSKWNAAHTEIKSEAYVLIFDTAWVPVGENVLEKLSKKLPFPFWYGYCEEQITCFGGEELYLDGKRCYSYHTNDYDQSWMFYQYIRGDADTLYLSKKDSDDLEAVKYSGPEVPPGIAYLDMKPEMWPVQTQ